MWSEIQSCHFKQPLNHTCVYETFIIISHWICGSTPMDMEPIKDKGKAQLYLESCPALAFDIVSVFAKPVAHPTNFVIMAHPTCEKMSIRF